MQIKMSSLKDKINLQLLLKVGIVLLFLFVSLSNGAGYFPESRYFFYGILAILAGIWFFEGGFSVKKIDCFFILFLFIAALSARTLNNFHDSMDSLFLLSSYFFFFWIVRENFKSKCDVNLIFILVVSIATLLSVYGIYQYLIGFDVLTTYAAERGILIDVQSRVSATLISPNTLAGFLAIAIPLNIFLILQAPKIWEKVIFLITGGMIGCCFFLTYSRGGLIALSVAMLFMLFFIGKEKRIKLLTVFIILVFLVFSGYLLVQIYRPSSTIVYSGITKTSSAKTSFDGRLLLWRGSLNIFKDYPILGSGIGTFASIYPKYQYGGLYSRHAHNTYLEFLAETGFLGFLLFVSVLFLITRQQIKNLIRAEDAYFKNLTVVIFASSIIFLVHNLVDFDWQTPAIGLTFWMITGLAFAISGNTSGSLKKSSLLNGKVLIIIRKIGATSIIFVGVLILIFSYKAALLAERAENLSRDGKKSEAIMLLSAAIKIDPLKGLYRMRWIELSLESGTGAISNIRKQAEKAVVLEPESSYYHAKLAELYLKEKMIDDAEKEYKKAKELYPLSPYFPLLLGQFYVSQGDSGKAIDEFEDAVSLKNYYDVWYIEKPLEAISNAHLQLGNIYAQDGKLDKAVIEYKKALEINFNLAPAYYNLGYVYQSKKLIDNAIHNYKKTIELQPDYDPAYYNLGILYEEIGQMELAIIQFRKALELEPDNKAYGEKLDELEGDLR
ncbi:MAG TPA: tetratricopeptide repeat protein [Actinobacteria bacterium]|nr:tetratricopeptide repeat protein [Actinomycetota bacterium]